MTFKSTLAGTLITLVALASSAIGCSGGDDCTLAAEHLVDCLNPAGTPPSSTPTAAAKCNGTTECVAACVNRTECPALQLAYNGGTSPEAEEFLTCTRGCQEP